jgi:uncharacterized protein YqeY
MTDSQIRERLEHALRAALRSQDRVAVSAVRSALAAIGNAGSVPPQAAPGPAASGQYFAGSADGPGAGEAERRSLSEGQVADIVRAEIAERQAAAGEYELRGHPGRGGRLRREAQVLESVLGG